MPIQILKQVTYKSTLYNWSLRGHVPKHLTVKPIDPWPGDAEKGRALCQGAFLRDEEHLTLRGACWEPLGVDTPWLEHMHGFSWLRDLRALGGDTARNQARTMLESWIARCASHWGALPFRPDITGERIAIWISLYESFGASASDEFQDLFFESLIRQSRHLSRTLPGDLHGLPLLKGAKGLLYAGLGFEGYENWIENALDIFEEEIKVQILKDGAHISRSPAQLLEALQIFIDVRAALASAGYPLPEDIQHAIDRMVPALRFFRCGDKHFATLHGSQEGDSNLIDCILGQSNHKGKALQSLPCAGFERVTQGRTLLIFDCGAPPSAPYDARAHAAPLSFEMSYGKERIFTSCGSHPLSFDWQEALRATAAHNTLTIDNRNAFEIKNDGYFARKTSKIEPFRQESGQACLLEASHNGYLSLNGVIHNRRLYLSEKGHNLRGEDRLNCRTGLEPGRSLDIAIRFHIHPRVMVSLINEGQEALLRLPSGIGWRFRHSAGILALENTVYLGSGSTPRKSKQLVVYGQMSEDEGIIKWALNREGL